LDAAVSLYQTYIANRPQYQKDGEGEIINHASI
jgi:hypothetical protein